MIEAKDTVDATRKDPWELPDGWYWVPLERLCARIVGGGTPLTSRPEYFDGDIVWVAPSDLDETNPCHEVFTSQFTLTQAGLNASSAIMLPIGTVLFSSRATIGKIAIAGVPLCTNQGFVNFECNPEKMDNHYLAWCLRLLTRKIAKLAPSTTYAEVSRGNLRSFKIPIPYPEDSNTAHSLDMQYRVVSRVEALFSELKEARRLLTAMRDDLEQVMYASLAIVFDEATTDLKQNRWIRSTPTTPNTDSYHI
jgi:type I restriction enzyme, S subunit